MNSYWIVAFVILLSSVAIAGERYGVYSTEVTCQKQQEAQQQVTIAAENGVIATIGKQQTLTQESEHAYHTGIDVIDNLYRVQPNVDAASHNLSPLPVPACRTGTPQNSRKFGLTPKECDLEEEKLILLWQWIESQAAIR